MHKLGKPQAARSAKADDLPSLDSHSEDEDSWSSNVSERSEDEEDDSLSDDSMPSSSKLPNGGSRSRASDDEEMPYERLPRKHARQGSSDDEGISRLPIKSQDGRIHRSDKRIVVSTIQEDSNVSSDDERTPTKEEAVRRDDVATGARFGRPAVVDVVSKKSRRARIQAAKEQIASICQDIVGDPENSVCQILKSEERTLL